MVTDPPPASLPAGLSLVWRSDGPELQDEIAAWSIATFAPDGGLVAIGDATGVRVRRTGDGALVRMIWHGVAHRSAYSLALAPSGDVAIGRVGKVELHRSRGAPVRYPCADNCGPVGALAFSPDGALLAFQGARGLAERRMGLGAVNVADVRTGRVHAQLEASAMRARVAFSRDGGRVLAASTTPFDERESFGLRAWDVSDWTLAESFLGFVRAPRAAGALGGTEFGAVHERDGVLEAHDLATGRPLWSVKLIAPSLELGAAAFATRLALVDIAPSGEFLLSYESAAGAVGTLVVRDAADGAVAAMYDVPDVTALAISPDSRTFIYTTGRGRTYTALARVPL